MSIIRVLPMEIDEYTGDAIVAEASHYFEPEVGCDEVEGAPGDAPVTDLATLVGQLTHHQLEAAVSAHIKESEMENVNYVLCTNAPQLRVPCVPRRTEEMLLRLCYWKCLQKALENELLEIAFPLIGTGILCGYPRAQGLMVAVDTILAFFQAHPSTVLRVTICISGPSANDTMCFAGHLLWPVISRDTEEALVRLPSRVPILPPAFVPESGTAGDEPEGAPVTETNRPELVLDTTYETTEAPYRQALEDNYWRAAPELDRPVPKAYILSSTTTSFSSYIQYWDAEEATKRTAERMFRFRERLTEEKRQEILEKGRERSRRRRERLRTEEIERERELNRQRRQNLSQEQYLAERARSREHNRLRRAQETEEEYEIRLAKAREYGRMKRRRITTDPSTEQYEAELAKSRENTQRCRERETEEEHKIRLEKAREYARKKRQRIIENKEQYETELAKRRENGRKKWAQLSPEQYEAELARSRENLRKSRERETEEKYKIRLEKAREYARKKREMQRAAKEAAERATPTEALLGVIDAQLGQGPSNGKERRPRQKKEKSNGAAVPTVPKRRGRPPRTNGSSDGQSGGNLNLPSESDTVVLDLKGEEIEEGTEVSCDAMREDTEVEAS